jgi:hypothetical protein
MTDWSASPQEGRSGEPGLPLSAVIKAPPLLQRQYTLGGVEEAAAGGWAPPNEVPDAGNLPPMDLPLAPAELVHLAFDRSRQVQVESLAQMWGPGLDWGDLEGLEGLGAGEESGGCGHQSGWTVAPQ